MKHVDDGAMFLTKTQEIVTSRETVVEGGNKGRILVGLDESKLRN